VARRRYLVAYGIRDERRLRQVAVCMEGYGLRIQCSVFVCGLSGREKAGVRGDIEAIMKPSGDSVMIIDLGRAGDSSRFLFLGRHERLPSASAAAIV
jgi:CRISPR-associated protein Cas2